MAARIRRGLGAAVAVVLLASLAACGAVAGPSTGSSLGTVRVSQLPAEARRTLTLIDAGGPFPYGQDGEVFQNRERLLPAEPSGYYHEYTVPTPGERDRGARRIIAGSKRERYYTADHYGSFREIVAG